VRTPGVIAYRGYRYVLATEHARCPTGQHWNEPQHKCWPVAGYLPSGKPVFVPKGLGVMTRLHRDALAMEGDIYAQRQMVGLRRLVYKDARKHVARHHDDFSHRDHLDARNLYYRKAKDARAAGKPAQAKAYHSLGLAHEQHSVDKLLRVAPQLVHEVMR